jgi:hypothetical protein
MDKKMTSTPFGGVGRPHWNRAEERQSSPPRRHEGTKVREGQRRAEKNQREKKREKKQ